MFSFLKSKSIYREPAIRDNDNDLSLAQKMKLIALKEKNKALENLYIKTIEEIKNKSEKSLFTELVVSDLLLFKENREELTSWLKKDGFKVKDFTDKSIEVSWLDV